MDGLFTEHQYVIQEAIKQNENRRQRAICQFVLSSNKLALALYHGINFVNDSPSTNESILEFNRAIEKEIRQLHISCFGIDIIPE